MKISNKKVCLFGLSFLAILLLSSLDAFAAGGVAIQGAGTNALENVLCNALELITGPAGKTIASFGVIALGAGFFMGKINWNTMLAMALGIAALFGAPAIVDAITGDEEPICDQ